MATTFGKWSAKRTWRHAARQSTALIALIGLLGARSALGQPRHTDCDVARKGALVDVHVPNPPFEAISSPDGCWVFASLFGGQARGVSATARAGVAVLRRHGATLDLVRIFPLSPPVPLGLALTHDGKLLIVADYRVVYFMDTSRLVRGAQDAVLGALSVSRGERSCRLGPLCPGSTYLDVTPDDRILFVSDEYSNQVGVLDLRAARQSGFRDNSIIGSIPTDAGPGGLAVSSNGRYLYVTSEISPPGSGPAFCPSEVRGAPPHARGTVAVVDIARARTAPSESVIASVPAGCSPVRAVLSPDDRRLFVTARGGNELLVFDTDKLVEDRGEALISTIPVGSAPVGVATVDHGREIIVANTSRFGGGGGNDLTVIDATGIGGTSTPAQWTVPTATGPRELHAVPSGNALLVTDFGSRDIELIGLDLLRRR